MPKPSSNLFRCEPERLDLPLQGDQETAEVSARTQLMQGGLVNGWPTILIVLDVGLSSECRARVYAHELRSALDILEPAKVPRARKPKPPKAKAGDLLDRVITGKDLHRG